MIVQPTLRECTRMGWPGGFGGFGGSVGGYAPPSWDPTALTAATLKLWLRSDRGVTLASGLVTEWDDGSGSPMYAVGSSGSRPTCTAVAGMAHGVPAVNFTAGANLHIDTNQAGLLIAPHAYPRVGTPTVTIAAVARITGVTPDYDVTPIAGMYSGFGSNLANQRGYGLLMQTSDVATMLAYSGGNGANVYGIDMALNGSHAVLAALLAGTARFPADFTMQVHGRANYGYATSTFVLDMPTGTSGGSGIRYTGTPSFRIGGRGYSGAGYVTMDLWELWVWDGEPSDDEWALCTSYCNSHYH